MTEPADEMYDVAIIVGSEKSDVPAVIASTMLRILGTFGLSWRLAAISAHHHPDELKEFCQESPAHLFICAVGLNPGLPGAVAAYTNGAACPVIGVALPNAEADPDGSKCLTAMCLQPPGVPVLVVGVGKAGLVNAAYAAAFILGLINPIVRANRESHVASHRPLPNLNVMVTDTAARKESA